MDDERDAAAANEEDDLDKEINELLSDAVLQQFIQTRMEDMMKNKITL